MPARFLNRWRIRSLSWLPVFRVWGPGRIIQVAFILFFLYSLYSIKPLRFLGSGFLCLCNPEGSERKQRAIKPIEQQRGNKNSNLMP